MVYTKPHLEKPYTTCRSPDQYAPGHVSAKRLEQAM